MLKSIPVKGIKQNGLTWSYKSVKEAKKALGDSLVNNGKVFKQGELCRIVIDKNQYHQFRVDATTKIVLLGDNMKFYEEEENAKDDNGPDENSPDSNKKGT